MNDDDDDDDDDNDDDSNDDDDDGNYNAFQAKENYHWVLQTSSLLALSSAVHKPAASNIF